MPALSLSHHRFSRVNLSVPMNLISTYFFLAGLGDSLPVPFLPQGSHSCNAAQSCLSFFSHWLGTLNLCCFIGTGEHPEFQFSNTGCLYGRRVRLLGYISAPLAQKDLSDFISMPCHRKVDSSRQMAQKTLVSSPV